jgi:acyl dehydratase
VLDKKSIGKTTPPTLVEIEKGAVRRYAESVGDLNPMYFDAEYAKAAGYPSIVVPPSMVFHLTTGVELKDLVGVSARSLLLAESSLEFERSLYAGDRLLITVRLVDITERSGPTGRTEIAIVEDEARDDRGALVYRARRAFIVRNVKEP